MFNETVIVQSPLAVIALSNRWYVKLVNTRGYLLESHKFILCSCMHARRPVTMLSNDDVYWVVKMETYKVACLWIVPPSIAHSCTQLGMNANKRVGECN